jgi:hypothetical protein
VGDGESTFVLESVAKLWNAKLVSVDIADCKKIHLIAKEYLFRWTILPLPKSLNVFAK